MCVSGEKREVGGSKAGIRKKKEVTVYCVKYVSALNYYSNILSDQHIPFLKADTVIYKGSSIYDKEKKMCKT